MSIAETKKDKNKTKQNAFVAFGTADGVFPRSPFVSILFELKIHIRGTQRLFSVKYLLGETNIARIFYPLRTAKNLRIIRTTFAIDQSGHSECLLRRQKKTKTKQNKMHLLPSVRRMVFSQGVLLCQYSLS